VLGERAGGEPRTRYVWNAVGIARWLPTRAAWRTTVVLGYEESLISREGRRTYTRVFNQLLA
jgi:hypothetical protein